jgi:two-component system, chemotaxis family, protein-glutamate methylesterase/glutaminase
MAQTGRDIVVIGASAGGVTALQQIVSDLPAGFPAAVLVVLHTWPHARSYLPEVLSRAGRIPAVAAAHGVPIEPGRIFVAPSNHHLMVDDGRLFVSQGPRENRFRPAINPLFRSAAITYRERAIGVILTGMLDDGAAGMWAIKQCGGISVVQSDPQFDEMARAATQNAEIDHSVPLLQIAPLLDRLVRETPASPAESAIPEVLRINDEKAKMKATEMDLDRVGQRSVFTCPECNGALWELKEGSQLQFACHVGHSYTAQGLNAAQGLTIEQSLWSAIRALKENAAMHERLARQAIEHGLPLAAESYRRIADERNTEAAHLQGMLGSHGHRDFAPLGTD